MIDGRFYRVVSLCQPEEAHGTTLTKQGKAWIGADVTV